MRLWRLRVWLLGVLAATALAGAAAAEDVALTFDDLPVMALTDSVGYAKTTTRQLLSGLRRQHCPAIGFVNEGKLEGADRAARIALLARWVDAGMDLGNHSYSHESLTTTPVDAFIADVRRGEPVTRALLAAHGRSPHWFRHPYLETGPTLEIRRRFEAWLAANGYRVAPVTMENADWLFGAPYDDAVLRHDQARAGQVKQAYLAYTALAVAWYREAALQLLGRRPALVFLLHATRLNADSLDQLAAILKSDGLHCVSLEHAMTDPAYAIADNYAGPDGDEWLSRWSATLDKELPWESFPEPPADIAAEDQRLDPSP